MSYSDINRREVKHCRKRHRCVWCGEGIEIGDPAIYRAYEFQGYFMSDYEHPECYAAMMTFDDLDPDIGFMPGEHLRGTSKRWDD